MWLQFNIKITKKIIKRWDTNRYYTTKNDESQPAS